MNKSNEFKLYNMTISFYNYLRTNIVCNIPKVHNDLRIHLQDEAYTLIKNITSTSFTKGNIRNKHLNDSLINVSMIDALLSIVIELDCINKKNVAKAIGLLANVKNMLYAWKSRIDNNEKENS